MPVQSDGDDDDVKIKSGGGATLGPASRGQSAATGRAMSGALVYGVSGVRDDGCVEVVLGDGTRVRVHPTEIVAE